MNDVELMTAHASELHQDYSFRITVGSHATTYKWQEYEPTVNDFAGLLEEHDVRPGKDGHCFIGASFLGPKRNAKSVDCVCILTFDIDGAQSVDEVDGILANMGCTSFLYTTHSHRSTRTEIVVDHYERFARQAKQPLTPTTASLCTFFARHNRHLPDNAQYVGYDRVADKGNVYVLEHAPMDKMRVVLPLAKPIEIGSLAASNKQAEDAYKAIYSGVGNALGLKFDHSCADPCRLHYFPSCPPERAHVAISRVYGKGGPLLDWTKYTRAEVTTRQPSKKAGRDTCEINGRNLKAWPCNYEQDHPFDVEGFAATYLSDQILAERASGGYTITCPFEVEHSTPGGEGTFCTNADDAGHPWTIYCSHNACQSAARGRLDYVREWIAQELVTVEQIDEHSGRRVPPARRRYRADFAKLGKKAKSS